MAARATAADSAEPAGQPTELRRRVHDLANALATATARISILAGSDLPAAVAHDLRLALDDIRRAREMARELLEIPERDTRQSVPLLEVWSSAARDLETAGFTVSLESPESAPEAAVSRARIGQILSSIASAEVAACRRGDVPPVVSALLRSEGDRVVLSIRSAAPAFPPDERHQLLSTFFLRNPDDLGAGIGFGICARIAQSEGGAFLLDAHDGRREYRLELPRPGATELPAPKAGTVGATGKLPASVLVIDDDPHVRESCALLLRHLGHTVEFAASGAEAIDRLARERYDVVILDLHLGDSVDGAGVLANVEQTQSGILDRLIISTGDPGHPTAQDVTRRLGVRVLAKPFGLEELCTVIGGLPPAR